MELGGFSNEQKKFSSPEEEIAFLRNEIKKREVMTGGVPEKPKDEIIHSVVKDYANTPAPRIIKEEKILKPQEEGAVILKISPESHDKQIESLVGLLQEKGLKNVLSVIEKMANPHLEDDFHRFLIQYIKAGYPVPELSESSPIWKPSHMTLYEITLPEVPKEEANVELKKFISSMEQFFAGMLGSYRAEDYFTIEIANANGSDEFIFYSSVPDSKKDLFEKQMHSLFPGVRIKEEKNDYNIFNPEGGTAGSFATLRKNPILPLKNYENFDSDPLAVVLNSFSKIDRDGEGASIQIVFRPAGPEYLKGWSKALGELEKGVPTPVAIDVPFGMGEKIFKGIGDLLHPPKDKKDKLDSNKRIDQIAVDNVKFKISAPIVLSNIRLLTSASNTKLAEEILTDLEASFAQFENTGGNRISFARVEGSRLREFVREFSWRMYSDREVCLLNLKELTTLMHFPTSHLKSTMPQLKKAESGVAPAPVGLPTEGTLVGVNRARGMENKVFILPEDRMRHFYAIGQTGTGKTTLLKNMIIQDIKSGAGVCMIDPHGSDIQEILSSIPKERYEDVIYFDPSYTERPMALNMLEYDKRFPEQKIFVVNEMLSIFNKLFDLKQTGGPMFEQYFRNSVLLTLEDSDSGATLLDVSRVLVNKPYREYKLSKCQNPIVLQFWREVADKAGGEAALQNIVPYVTSKFDNFLANDIMRPIISQQVSSFNFREVMDKKKILLVNLAKGRLGDLNSHLLGLIIVGKFLMAALSRVDSLGQKLSDFYLYIDEFQNVTTDSIAVILSEARKYRLGLNIAHQFIGQLSDTVKGAVFGNVGTIASFRVGPEDAELLEKQFEPIFTARDIADLPNRHAYMRLLVNGRPIKPFNIETLPVPEGNFANIDKLKQLSYLKYGKDKKMIEAEILERYKK